LGKAELFSGWVMDDDAGGFGIIGIAVLEMGKIEMSLILPRKLVLIA